MNIRVQHERMFITDVRPVTRDSTLLTKSTGFLPCGLSKPNPLLLALPKSIPTVGCTLYQPVPRKPSTVILCDYTEYSWHNAKGLICWRSIFSKNTHARRRFICINFLLKVLLRSLVLFVFSHLCK